MAFDPFSFTNFEKLLEFLVIGLELVYVVFAFIATRQVKLMCASFSTKVGVFFLGFARLHLLASIGLVLLSILLLG